MTSRPGNAAPDGQRSGAIITNYLLFNHTYLRKLQADHSVDDQASFVARGVRDWYGFRDNAYFWFTRGRRPYRVPIPEEKAVNVSAVQFAAQRIDPDIEWQEDACAKLVKVPRIFLGRVISGCVEAAKAEGITVITPEFLDRIQDKRSQDRGG